MKQLAAPTSPPQKNSMKKEFQKALQKTMNNFMYS